jgi:transcription initiation factor TFIIIB Brf1 subunit/transcription initiation factor TFIIB
VKTFGQFKQCRLCGEKTYDFDSETGEWWCDDCDDWAVL